MYNDLAKISRHHQQEPKRLYNNPFRADYRQVLFLEIEANGARC